MTTEDKKTPTAAAPVQHEDFFQQVGDELMKAWADVEWFGKEVVTELETVAEKELAAVKAAIVSVGGEFVPKQLALIHGWVSDFKAKVGNNANPFAAAEYCVGQDAVQEVQFINGELSVGLQAVAAAFLNSI